MISNNHDLSPRKIEHLGVLIHGGEARSLTFHVPAEHIEVYFIRRSAAAFRNSQPSSLTDSLIWF
jgi:hypothetical protein